MTFSVHAESKTKTAKIRKKQDFIVDTKIRNNRIVKTISTVKFESGTVVSIPYQTQIDAINQFLDAELPVDDMRVVDTTDYLATYLITRG